MKPLDVVNCIDFGYRLVWRERRYLLRLAAAPLLVKLVCMLALLALGWGHNYLRMGLVMLPSFFVEGWMLAHVARLIFHSQRWPFRPSGDPDQDRTILLDRAYGVMTGALCYTVIKFLLSGLLAVMASMQIVAQQQIDQQAATGAEPSMGVFFAAVAFLGLTLWGFRFMFLYIPAAAGIGTDIIARARKPVLLSVQMMGVWLVSFVPFALLAALLTAVVLPQPVDGAAVPSGGATVILLVVQAAVDTLIAIVSTTAIAAGLRNMIEKSRTIV